MIRRGEKQDVRCVRQILCLHAATSVVGLHTAPIPPVQHLTLENGGAKGQRRVSQRFVLWRRLPDSASVPHET